MSSSRESKKSDVAAKGKEPKKADFAAKVRAISGQLDITFDKKYIDALWELRSAPQANEIIASSALLIRYFNTFLKDKKSERERQTNEIIKYLTSYKDDPEKIRLMLLGIHTIKETHVKNPRAHDLVIQVDFIKPIHRQFYKKDEFNKDNIKKEEYAAIKGFLTHLFGEELVKKAITPPSTPSPEPNKPAATSTQTASQDKIKTLIDFFKNYSKNNETKPGETVSHEANQIIIEANKCIHTLLATEHKGIVNKATEAFKNLAIQILVAQKKLGHLQQGDKRSDPVIQIITDIIKNITNSDAVIRKNAQSNINRILKMFGIKASEFNLLTSTSKIISLSDTGAIERHIASLANAIQKSNESSKQPTHDADDKHESSSSRENQNAGGATPPSHSSATSTTPPIGPELSEYSEEEGLVDFVNPDFESSVIDPGLIDLEDDKRTGEDELADLSAHQELLAKAAREKEATRLKELSTSQASAFITTTLAKIGKNEQAFKSTKSKMNVAQYKALAQSNKILIDEIVAFQTTNGSKKSELDDLVKRLTKSNQSIDIKIADLVEEKATKDKEIKEQKEREKAKKQAAIKAEGFRSQTAPLLFDWAELDSRANGNYSFRNASTPELVSLSESVTNLISELSTAQQTAHTISEKYKQAGAEEPDSIQQNDDKTKSRAWSQASIKLGRDLARNEQLLSDIQMQIQRQLHLSSTSSSSSIGGGGGGSGNNDNSIAEALAAAERIRSEKLSAIISDINSLINNTKFAEGQLEDRRHHELNLAITKAKLAFDPKDFKSDPEGRKIIEATTNAHIALHNAFQKFTKSTDSLSSDTKHIINAYQQALDLISANQIQYPDFMKIADKITLLGKQRENYQIENRDASEENRRIYSEHSSLLPIMQKLYSDIAKATNEPDTELAKAEYERLEDQLKGIIKTRNEAVKGKIDFNRNLYEHALHGLTVLFEKVYKDNSALLAAKAEFDQADRLLEQYFGISDEITRHFNAAQTAQTEAYAHVKDVDFDKAGSEYKAAQNVIRDFNFAIRPNEILACFERGQNILAEAGIAPDNRRVDQANNLKTAFIHIASTLTQAHKQFLKNLGCHNGIKELDHEINTLFQGVQSDPNNRSHVDSLNLLRNNYKDLYTEAHDPDIKINADAREEIFNIMDGTLNQIAAILPVAMNVDPNASPVIADYSDVKFSLLHEKYNEIIAGFDDTNRLVSDNRDLKDVFDAYYNLHELCKDTITNHIENNANPDITAEELQPYAYTFQILERMCYAIGQATSAEREINSRKEVLDPDHTFSADHSQLYDQEMKDRIKDAHDALQDAFAYASKSHNAVTGAPFDLNEQFKREILLINNLQNQANYKDTLRNADAASDTSHLKSLITHFKNHKVHHADEGARNTATNANLQAEWHTKFLPLYNQVQNRSNNVTMQIELLRNLIDFNAGDSYRIAELNKKILKLENAKKLFDSAETELTSIQNKILRTSARAETVDEKRLKDEIARLENQFNHAPADQKAALEAAINKAKEELKTEENAEIAKINALIKAKNKELSLLKATDPKGMDDSAQTNLRQDIAAAEEHLKQLKWAINQNIIEVKAVKLQTIKRSDHKTYESFRDAINQACANVSSSAVTPVTASAAVITGAVPIASQTHQVDLTLEAAIMSVGVTPDKQTVYSMVSSMEPGDIKDCTITVKSTALNPDDPKDEQGYRLLAAKLVEEYVAQNTGLKIDIYGANKVLTEYMKQYCDAMRNLVTDKVEKKKYERVTEPAGWTDQYTHWRGVSAMETFIKAEHPEKVGAKNVYDKKRHWFSEKLESRNNAEVDTVHKTLSAFTPKKP